MLKRLTPRDQIGMLLDQFTLAIRDAFMAAIADIQSRLTLSLIVARLEKGDVAGAVDAIGIERGAFNPVLDDLQRAFNAGGNSAADNLPALRGPEGHRVSIRFDARNLRAEAWLRQHSAALVTNIVEDQRSAIRAALTSGLARGANPKTVALDIVGRLDRAAGSRVGGLIGLTGQQSSAVALARQELSSGEIGAMRNYLARARRDRRFDKTVLAAIEVEKPIPAEMVTRITGRYADRLLQLRGEVLARTETLTALNRASVEAMNQAIDTGAINAGVVTKVWRTARDNRVRDSHAELDGQTAPIDGVFANGLAYPGDPSGPPEEIINCRCFLETRIDFFAGLA